MIDSPKLHHYVPQFYLRRFTDGKGKLWAWDKQADRVFPTAPRSIAAGTQFYRLTQFEIGGHDPMTMEKQLSKMEGEVAEFTSDWLERLEMMAPLEVLPISRTNRKTFAVYLAVQFLRTADTREILSSLLAADRGSPISERELREAHTELMWDQTTVELLATRFQRSIWIFARNDSVTPLITSDNPIAFRTGNNRQWLRAGVLSRETYLVYPLSPQVVLYCHPQQGKFRKLAKFADSLSPVPLDDGMVKSENSGQVFMASRFVFSNHNQFDVERAFAKTIGTDHYRGSSKHIVP